MKNTKNKIHPRSKHRNRYDFKQLISAYQKLAPFVQPNDYGDESVDFFNPEAVTALNTALLMHFYELEYWEIPKGYLCPPIPGRADYIHYIADILAETNYGSIPKGKQIKCLDIGVGANCVYPIIGHQEYGWSFIGSDIDTVAIESAKKIIDLNPNLKDSIHLRLQSNPKNILRGVLKKDEQIEVVICNPPFHSSAEEAQKGSLRKIKNLKHEPISKASLNFGGQSNELWCEGGEVAFIKTLIKESRLYSTQCKWFTSLVSKEKHLHKLYKALKTVHAANIKTIAMGQGNKASRIIAWHF
ncbi:MAG: 23S rRNA (adenine(1618)-N(6))-methyltransferase RlmF [Bacteroidales bacterium]|nr:23S rRNA (adenine(1618)-N(6))-methyltransferase RlmF [Bacteroidales bacterium]